jgi:DNA mismatch endonuclease (patch repair protein)
VADIVSADVRSRMMSGIRSRDTKPELLLRCGLHKKGFRFRVHAPELPGKPDIVFPRYKAVLLAHGCFWHGHDCHLFKLPSTRQEFWRAKIERNRLVDARAIGALNELGWRVGVVWECALKGRSRWPVDHVIGACAVWLRGDGVAFEIKGE